MFLLEENRTLSGEVNPSKLFCLPPEKVSTIKRSGGDYFLLEQIPFLILLRKKSNWKSQKLFLTCTKWQKLYISGVTIHLYSVITSFSNSECLREERNVNQTRG